MLSSPPFCNVIAAISDVMIAFNMFYRCPITTCESKIVREKEREIVVSRISRTGVSKFITF